MNCSEVQNLIPQYLSGELDDDIRRRVEEHISGCPDCQEGMRREQSLRHLICQSADDPPGDYWDDYNDELRSRIRGAVAMSWRMGCLPGGLLGLIVGGLIVGPICVWLSCGDGLGKVHPDWLRWLLATALILIVGYGMSIISGLVIRCTTRGLPKYEREERGLERIISRNPRYRAAFVAFFMLVALGTPAFLAGFTFWIGWYLPTWARFSFAVVVFLGFASILPGYYQYLRGFISGSQIPGRSRKYRLWHAALHYLACVAMLAVVASVAWNTHVHEHLDAPLACRDEADAAYRSGDAGRAISILRSCIRKYDDTYHVLGCYENLGRIYVEMGKEKQSLVIFHEGIKTYERLLLHTKYSYSKDEQLDFLYDAAQLYIDLYQNREAYRTYTSMLRLSPNDPENIYSVAQGYMAVGHKDEGKALYARIIIEFPRSPAAGWSRDELKRMAQGKNAPSK
jgi:tetratricopeptide (TPR) repeat protein